VSEDKVPRELFGKKFQKNHHDFEEKPRFLEDLGRFSAFFY